MNAKTKIIALACGALLALTGTASAHHGANNTKVYAGKVAGTDRCHRPRDRHRRTCSAGRRHQQEPARRKVRNLKPNTDYTFGLDGVSDFAPTTATTDENGKLKGFAKSDTFNAADGATYTVVVKEGDVTVASSTLAPVHAQGLRSSPQARRAPSQARRLPEAGPRRRERRQRPRLHGDKGDTTPRRPRPSASATAVSRGRAAWRRRGRYHHLRWN